MTVKLTKDHIKMLRVLRQCEDWNIEMGIFCAKPSVNFDDLIKAKFIEIRTFNCVVHNKKCEGAFVTEVGRELEAKVYATKTKY